jgi:hypothetical protein
VDDKVDLLNQIPKFVFYPQVPAYCDMVLNKFFNGSQQIVTKFKDERQVFVNQIDFKASAPKSMQNLQILAKY